MTRIMLVAICIAGISFAHAATARADGALIAVGGDAGEQDRTIVGSAARGVLSDAGWDLPAKPMPVKDSQAVLKCAKDVDPGACVIDQLVSVNASGTVRRVLLVMVDRQPTETGTPILQLTAKLVFIAEKTSLLVKQRYCDHCSDSDLAAASATLTKSLVDELAIQAGRTVLEIRSVPTGAQVKLDGQGIGATDGRFNTFAGQHKIVVEKPGFLSETRDITVAEGSTANVAVELRSVDPKRQSATQEPHTPETRSYLAPTLFIGAGVVVAGLGGVSIYYGQRDGYYHYTHATAIGVSADVLGAASIATGIYLLLRSDHRSAPTATVTSTGGTVGWMGRF